MFSSKKKKKKVSPSFLTKSRICGKIGRATSEARIDGYRGICKFGKGTNFLQLSQLFFLFSLVHSLSTFRCIDDRGVDFLPRRLKLFEEEEERGKNISLSINVSLLSPRVKEFLLRSPCRVSRISLVQNLANCERSLTRALLHFNATPCGLAFLGRSR